MAFGVKPALKRDDPVRVGRDFGERGEERTPSQEGVERAPQAGPCPGCVRRRSKRSWQDTLRLRLGQGESRYCRQGLGLPGPQSANWAESRGCRIFSFVSGLLSLLLPSGAGF